MIMLVFLCSLNGCSKYDASVSHDSENYLRARYYEPSVGRFITRDTYTGESDEPLSLHLYTYCENDGVNAWDPSGHWEDKDNQEKLHKKFKDNPSAVFDKNIRTGKYRWRMLFDSKEKNPRCEKAINDSIVFLRKAFSYMQ